MRNEDCLGSHCTGLWPWNQTVQTLNVACRFVAGIGGETTWMRRHISASVSTGRTIHRLSMQKKTPSAGANRFPCVLGAVVSAIPSKSKQQTLPVSETLVEPHSTEHFDFPHSEEPLRSNSEGRSPLTSKHIRIGTTCGARSPKQTNRIVDKSLCTFTIIFPLARKSTIIRLGRPTLVEAVA